MRMWREVCVLVLVGKQACLDLVGVAAQVPEGAARCATPCRLPRRRGRRRRRAEPRPVLCLPPTALLAATPVQPPSLVGLPAFVPLLTANAVTASAATNPALQPHTQRRLFISLPSVKARVDQMKYGCMQQTYRDTCEPLGKIKTRAWQLSRWRQALLISMLQLGECPLPLVLSRFSPSKLQGTERGPTAIMAVSVELQPSSGCTLSRMAPKVTSSGVSSSQENI